MHFLLRIVGVVSVCLTLTACGSSDEDLPVVEPETANLDPDANPEPVSGPDGTGSASEPDQPGAGIQEPIPDNTAEGTNPDQSPDQMEESVPDNSGESSNPDQAPDVIPELELAISCEQFQGADRAPIGSLFEATLPADLSVPGTRIEMLETDSQAPVSFDPLSAQLSFSPNDSHLASVFNYQIVDSDGRAIAVHEHHIVFAPLRVMPLGDSITSGVEFFDGVDTPPFESRVGYRQFLFDSLTAAGIEIDYLGQSGQDAGTAAGLVDPQNNGFPGVDIAFIEDKLLDLLNEADTDVILLHIGTNNTPTTADGIIRILDLIDTWEQTNHPIVVLLATIVPKRDPALNAVVDLFNVSMRAQLAQRVGDDVFLVDQNSVVSVDDISTEQIGLHPSAAGYEKMAQTWEEALFDHDLVRVCE